MITDKNDGNEIMIDEKNKLLLGHPGEKFAADESTHVIWDEKEGSAITITA
jgi:hypothetical protein